MIYAAWKCLRDYETEICGGVSINQQFCTFGSKYVCSVIDLVLNTTNRQCFLVLNTTKYDIPQKMKIDFIIETDEAILPIEAKSGSNKAISLSKLLASSDIPSRVG